MHRMLIRIFWIAAGIALFALSPQFFLRFQDASIYSYAAFTFLTVVCALAGPVAGCLAGGLGTTLLIIREYHMLWDVIGRLFPRVAGIILGTAAAGLTLGALFMLARQWERAIVRLLLHVCSVIVASAVGFCLVASLVDAALMAYSFQMALRRNVSLFVGSGVMMMIGVPIAMALEAWIRKRAPGLLVDGEKGNDP